MREAGGGMLPACSEQGPAETAGSKIDKVLNDTGDATNEAADTTGDVIEEAADDTRSAIDDATN